MISGILISSDFINTFPQTKDPDIQGITASCFSVSESSLADVVMADIICSWAISLVACWQPSTETDWAGKTLSG